jgi:FixJ family two-component response regulator
MMKTTSNIEGWRPIAYVALHDTITRTRITNVLERAGWIVLTQPTGFHLLAAISDVIEDRAWLRPAMIVIDSRSRGCAGTTIAAGLRDLGIAIPIVLVAAPNEVLPISSDDLVRITESAAAEQVVDEIARRPWRIPPRNGPPDRVLAS